MRVVKMTVPKIGDTVTFSGARGAPRKGYRGKRVAHMGCRVKKGSGVCMLGGQSRRHGALFPKNGVFPDTGSFSNTGPFSSLLKKGPVSPSLEKRRFSVAPTRCLFAYTGPFWGNRSDTGLF